MKSTDFHKIIRSVVAPWLKTHGFKKTTTVCWVRAFDDDYFVIWFQLSPGGNDYYTGSEFTVEFQICSSDRPGGHGLPGRPWTGYRLPDILTLEELEFVRRGMNQVRTKFIKPPPGHWVFQQRQSSIDFYFRQFDQIEHWTEPYRNLIWFPFMDQEDVEMWASFLLNVLPDVVQRMETEHSRKKREA